MVNLNDLRPGVFYVCVKAGFAPERHVGTYVVGCGSGEDPDVRAEIIYRQRVGPSLGPWCCNPQKYEYSPTMWFEEL
jgi:hypothetical protein